MDSSLRFDNLYRGSQQFNLKLNGLTGNTSNNITLVRNVSVAYVFEVKLI